MKPKWFQPWSLDPQLSDVGAVLGALPPVGDVLGHLHQPHAPVGVVQVHVLDGEMGSDLEELNTSREAPQPINSARLMQDQ